MEKILVKQCPRILRTILPKMNVLCSSGFYGAFFNQGGTQPGPTEVTEMACGKYTSLCQEGFVSTVTEILLESQAGHLICTCGTFSSQRPQTTGRQMVPSTPSPLTHTRGQVYPRGQSSDLDSSCPFGYSASFATHPQALLIPSPKPGTHSLDSVSTIQSPLESLLLQEAFQNLPALS